MNAKTKDNILYLAIALGIVTLVVVPLVYSVIRGEDIPAFPLKPVWLVVSTILLVVYAGRELTRRQLKNRLVLSIISVAAALHVVATAGILHSVARVPLLFLSVAIVVEVQLILQITDRLIPKPRNPRIE